jgi:galactokinase
MPDDPAPLEIARAPGRVGLMGDHMEYNEGLALTAAIDLDTWIALRRRDDGIVRMVSRHSRDAGTFRIGSLRPGVEGRRRSWSNYVAGTAWSLREAAIPIAGFDGIVETALPIGGGLGSSAALELASALALIGRNRVLAPAALAAIAQRAERDYLDIDAGILDQLACAAGREGRALMVDCRSLETRQVVLPFGVRVVVCDTGEKRDPSLALTALRRAECARAVALLAEKLPGLCSLRDLDVASLRRHRAGLPEHLAARAEYVVSENARVVATAAALETGDLDALCRLFAESHASLRDRYEAGSPALDAMVDVARAVPGVIASRTMGIGLGGCTVNLVLADAVPALVAAAARDYDALTGLRSRVYAVAVVDGAGLLRP